MYIVVGLQGEPGARRGHMQQHHPPQGGADRGAEVLCYAAGRQRRPPGHPRHRFLNQCRAMVRHLREEDPHCHGHVRLRHQQQHLHHQLGVLF